MRTEVFIRQLQCKVETFLARKGTKSHISLSQNISNITFGKVQTVSLTLYLPEIQKLIRQVQQPFRIMLHDVQIFMSFRVQMLFQNDILQRSFYQCQRSADFMCYVRKEIYLGIINSRSFSCSNFSSWRRCCLLLRCLKYQKVYTKQTINNNK